MFLHRHAPTPLALLFAMGLQDTARGAQDDLSRGLRIRPTVDAEDSWWDGDKLTGDWGGARDAMEARGWTLTADVIADGSWPFDGARRDRRTDRALVDVALEVDLERAWGVRDTTVFAELYAFLGRDGSRDVGDVQAFSNIDGQEVEQLSELWIERIFDEGAGRLKAGKVDANSEFAYANAGVQFLHSSAGFSPTILALPTYPDPAVGLNLFAYPDEEWRVGLGVYNARDGGVVSGRRGLTAEFDAAFLIGEVGRTWNDRDGRLVLGMWRHTGELDRFAGGAESSATGTYAILEQRLTREDRSNPKDRQGLTLFLQWGGADEDVSAVEQHVGAGLVYTGLVPHRDSWQTGLYVSRADLSDDPAAGLGGRELAVELFQEIRLTPGVTLKPDLQYIANPSGSTEADDVWVATLRLELSL